MRRNKEWDQKVERELRRWPGISVWREHSGGKHPKLRLAFGKNQRFITYPASPTRSPTAILNHLQDVRRELINMGATRLDERKKKGRIS